MKALVSLLSRSVQRFPWVTVVLVLLVSFGIMSFNREIEQAEANEGFAPEAEALAASERIPDLFGDESSGSVLQIIVSADGGDVVTADGAAAVRQITETLLASELADDLQAGNGQPPIASFLAPLEGAPGQGPTLQLVVSSADGDVVTPDGLAAVRSIQQALFSSPVAEKLDTASGQPPVSSFLAPLESAQGPSLQLVVKGSDVFTAEGLQLTVAAEQAVFSTPLAAKFVQDGPPVTSYLLPVESAIAQGAPADLPTPGVKQTYLEVAPELPPEVVPVLGFLASNDADLSVPQASAGLISFSLTEPASAEEVEAVRAALAAIEAPEGVSVSVLTPEPATAGELKELYRERLAFVPAEVVPFLDFLLSNDRDPAGPSASKGLITATLTEPLTAADEAGLLSALSSAPLPSGYAVSFLPSDPTDTELKAAYLDRLAFVPAEQAGLVENLLSADRDLAVPSATHGLMIVFLESPDFEDTDAQIDAALRQQAAVDAIAELDLPDGYSAQAFSFELIFASADDSTAEIGRMFGLAALIIVVVLLFNFWRRLPAAGTVRSVRRMLATTVVTLVVILMAIGIMQGIGVLLGPKYLGIIGDFNQIVQILPILLIGLGVDYGIHMTTRYQEELGAGADVERGTGIAIRTVGVALVLATVTTVVGFLTNLVSPVPALKDFGILAAVGIVVSFVLMLTLMPAIRLILDKVAERNGHLDAADFASEGARGGAIGALLAGFVGGAAVYAASASIEAGIKSVGYGEVFEVAQLGLFAVIGAAVGLVIIFLPRIVGPTGALAERFPVWVVIAALAIGGVGYYGFQQLETRFSFTDFVPSDNPLLGAIDLLTDEFGGGFGETTSILIEGNVATPDVHNAQVDALEALGDTPDVVLFGDAAAQDSVLSVLGSLIDPSLPTFSTDVAGAAQAAGVGSDLRVAADADVEALYGAVQAAAPNEFASVVHGAGGSYTAGLWTINTQAGDLRAGELNDNLVEVFDPVVGAGVSAIPTSQNIIGDVVVKSLQASQVSSLWITLIAATLLLILNFWIESRRPLLGVITMLPVALVVLATFGTMAVTGIPFGPVTATISALAIGIGVPYTIHITHRFQEDRIRHDSTEAAIRSTTLHTGGALAGSALTTMAGFGSLVTSALTPFQQFGAVTFYAIFYALAFSILLLPSMLVLWDRWHRSRGEATIDESRLHEALEI